MEIVDTAFSAANGYANQEKKGGSRPEDCAKRTEKRRGPAGLANNWLTRTGSAGWMFGAELTEFSRTILQAGQGGSGGGTGQAAGLLLVACEVSAKNRSA